ncbi:MAG: LacI family DNA-binding transcriptional regulator [Pseudomonadota bacterium]
MTIKQVAERAGVSLMTVSRVINKNGIVKSTTRDRVQQAINDLNYRPNISARRLAGGKSLFLGLVYQNPSPSYLSSVLIGALAACRAIGCHLVLEDLGQQAPYERPEETVQSLKSAGLDGVIVTPPLSNHEPFIETLENYGLAVVRVAPKNIHTDKLRVAMDDTQAARDMMEYLVDAGHRQIGFVKGPPTHASSGHRLNGFLSGAREFKLNISDDLLIQGDFTYRSGFDAGRELLSRPERPTAIFACNDDMAAGVVAAAYRQGLSVPDDVSVVGFDDTEIATNIWPELTTVKQPIGEMADHAVRLLAASIRGQGETIQSMRALLDHKIIERDTVRKLT